jgi:hypothetical protein
MPKEKEPVTRCPDDHPHHWFYEPLSFSGEGKEMMSHQVRWCKREVCGKQEQKDYLTLDNSKSMWRSAVRVGDQAKVPMHMLSKEDIERIQIEGAPDLSQSIAIRQSQPTVAPNIDIGLSVTSFRRPSQTPDY